MSALTRDRNTEMQYATLVGLPMATGAKIHAGALVVINATGYAQPGSSEAGLIYAGRAEDAEDNSAGADGDQLIHVRRMAAFKWANDGTVTPAHLFKTAYIVDDQTVSGEGEGTLSVAGQIIGIEPDGVWVE
jgi:hypothetical protein